MNPKRSYDLITRETPMPPKKGATRRVAPTIFSYGIGGMGEWKMDFPQAGSLGH